MKFSLNFEMLVGDLIEDFTEGDLLFGQVISESLDDFLFFYLFLHQHHLV